MAHRSISRGFILVNVLLSLVMFGVACNKKSQPTASGLASADFTLCAQEIALDCPVGTFDGCALPGLTHGHACVAESDRHGATPCSQEIGRICDGDLQDACTLNPAPSSYHVCVQPPSRPNDSNTTIGTGSDAVEDSGLTACAQEIALDCPQGTFDGCEVAQLTEGHICVAEENRQGAEPCNQEIARICDDGLDDACYVNPRASNYHVCVASKQARPVDDEDASAELTPCSQEIALECPQGSFDGCAVSGLTKGHICVLDTDQGGSSSCSMEIAKVCDSGFEDACLATPRSADQHICVQEIN